MSAYKPPSLDEVRRASEWGLFNVVSLFAGCGGSSTGYRLAGGKVLGVNEFIEAARETYAANYPDVTIMPEDIRELKGEEILRRVGVKAGELDVLDGSPPCASFSMAGKREEHWGKKKQYSETKQRTDDLFFEFARIIKETQPRVFVGENVKGLTLGKAGDLLGSKQSGLFGEHEDTILFHLEKLGYRVDYKVLNAADYGVPQTRERLFLVGVRGDLGVDPSFPSPTYKGKWVTLRAALETLEQHAAEIDDAAIPEKYEVYKYLKMMKPGESASKYHPKGSYFSLVRLEWDKPAGTVQQSHGAKSIASGSIHPEENRKLSIPELRRISSFPDDFVLTGTFEQRWERIGRAVPPLLMKAIARNVWSNILEPLKEGTEASGDAEPGDALADAATDPPAEATHDLTPEEEEISRGASVGNEAFERAIRPRGDGARDAYDNALGEQLDEIFGEEDPDAPDGPGDQESMF